MRKVDIVAAVLAILGFALLPAAAERRIAESCRNLGAFEVAGVVYKCRAK